jgi:hypothetical protein
MPGENSYYFSAFSMRNTPGVIGKRAASKREAKTVLKLFLELFEVQCFIG